MDQKKVNILIVKLFEQELSAEEAEQLEHWLRDNNHQDYFNEFVELKYSLNAEEEFDFAEPLEEAKRRIQEIQRKRRIRKILKYAAILIVILGVGGVLYFDNPLQQEPVVHSEKPIPVIVDNAIEIGKGKAILTLGDNTQIALDETSDYEGENVKGSGEELQYVSSNDAAVKLEYNTLTIPRGGQFSVRLSDGTKVWLNSDSQLKYPVEFISGQPREVELVYGEAYFEVSPSKDHQGDHFIAIHNHLKAEVLGTEFNMKAYNDEDQIYTTLAEGSIELNKGSAKVTLKPYDQAVTPSSDEEEIRVEQLSSLRELLWRQGEFSFKHKPLKEIMKVLSRWYDMKVEFKSKEKEEIKFTGALGKDQSIEEIMNIIQKTNDINYEIHHKTLTIK